MKELLVKGDKSFNEEFVKLLVDDEDYELLSMFDWVAHLTPTNKDLKITSKRKYDRFKYETWFGEKLPISSIGKRALYLESLMEHMMYNDSSWFMKPNLKFVNDDSKDYRKSNLVFNRKNKKDKRTYEEINKLRAIMMGVDPERSQLSPTRPVTIPWGVPINTAPTSFMLPNGINQQFPSPTEGYVVIKTKGEDYIHRVIRSRNELYSYLQSELIKPEEVCKDNEFKPFFKTEGEISLYIVRTSLSGRLENEVNNIAKYISGLVVDDDVKMDIIETLINYFEETKLQ